MTYTTDPKDPRLGHGSDKEPRPQNPVYLVLSDEERARGFVRPYRDAYVHKGRRVCGRFHKIESPLSAGQVAHVCSMEPGHEGDCTVYSAVTQPELDRLQKTGHLRGCDALTTMARPLSETYACNPKFYGSTYCATCRMHRPVNEFVWDADGKQVGS